MAIYRLYKNRSVKRAKKLDASQAGTEERESIDLDAGRESEMTSAVNDMPFTESKHLAHSSSDVEDDDAPDANMQSGFDSESARILPSKPSPTNTKKRKRTADSGGDSPLILHVVSDTPQPTSTPHPSAGTHPPSNPPAVKKLKTTGPSTKKISKRIAGGLKSSSSAEYPGGGRKGISSGLATVVRTNGARQLTGRRAAIAPAHRKGGAQQASGGSGASADWWSTL